MWGTQAVACAPMGTAGHRRVEHHRLPGHLASGTHGWGSGLGLGLGGNTVSSSHEETTDIRGVGVRRTRGSPKSRAPTALLSNPCCLCVSTTKKRHFSGGHQQSGGLGGPGWQRTWLCLHGTARTPAKASELQHMVGSPASRLTKMQVPLPGSQSPNSRASVCTQKKSEYSAKQREGEPTASSGCSVRELQPGSIPVWGGISSGMGGCPEPLRSCSLCLDRNPHPLPTDRHCSWSKEPLHAQRSTLPEAPCHTSPARGRAGPGDNPATNKKRVRWRDSPPGGSSPTAPRSQRHRQGCPSAGGTLGATTPLPKNGSFPPPGQRSWGAGSTPRCTHRSLGPFPPASAEPGLYNQQSGPWGRVGGVGGFRAGQRLRGRG